MQQRTSPRRRRHTTERNPTRHAQDTGLSRFNAHAAGIDVGAADHWVAVPAERDAQPVRRFGTFTADLYAIAQWLEQCAIRTVVMESTGIYVRRITARAISLAEGTGSEGNPWVNDSPGGESQGGQQHVVEAERPRSRVWSGSARPVCYGESLVA
jgi:hypothetical protein